MKKETMIANDLYERCGGALLSIADIMKYTGLGRTTTQLMLKNLATTEPASKCYWYRDVAELIARRAAL